MTVIHLPAPPASSAPGSPSIPPPPSLDPPSTAPARTSATKSTRFLLPPTPPPPPPPPPDSPRRATPRSAAPPSPATPRGSTDKSARFRPPLPPPDPPPADSPRRPRASTAKPARCLAPLAPPPADAPAASPRPPRLPSASPPSITAPARAVSFVRRAADPARAAAAADEARGGGSIQPAGPRPVIRLPSSAEIVGVVPTPRLRHQRSSRMSLATRFAPAESEGSKGRNVDSILNQAMRAYMNLELSGIGNDDMIKVSQAMRSNTSITSARPSAPACASRVRQPRLFPRRRENGSVAALNLSGCHGITDAGAANVVSLLSEHPSLRSISFAAVRRVGDLTCAALARCMGAEHRLWLSAANLSGCEAVGDAGLAALGGALKRNASLESLQLHGCFAISDEGVRALAAGVGKNSALSLLDLSWCEEISDAGMIALAEALLTNYSLATLKLSCCMKISDDGMKALARALEKNATLTSLDLSWCRKVGEAGLSALSLAMVKNQSLTELALTGCRCITECVAPRGPASVLHPTSSEQRAGNDLSRLMHYLEQNRKRAKLYAAAPRASAQLSAEAARKREHAKSSGFAERRGASYLSEPTGEGEFVKQTLRAAIMSGAALYNADDLEGCLNIFVQTAESVLVMNRSDVVVTAVNYATGPGRPIRDRVWMLRSAFDTLLDELGEES
ncbi:hypothetical protein AB1Y20_007654 [Prymnesium parvum]|uniref:F-box/LRR-repeat protein 15-like leucin rich repeat domain-containing protein n=1 Tax=Prymnesium parvum TaxID=97485 RepID=A0AB34IYA9_PRYPA